ncbi:MAG: trypsin-like serine protease [Deltaproteobacteria bacterium]|nr:trypsin-like serine protease [Deltaproteobacteria bacterium]
MIRRGVRMVGMGSLIVACAASAERSELRETVVASSPEGGADAASEATADQVEIIEGVPDRNRDPAVVAVQIGASGMCTGSLVSPRLVLTARHCVSRTVSMVSCPATGVQILGAVAPSSLGIWVGDDLASAHLVAHGQEVVAPSGVTLCDADIALIVLDTPVKVVKPLPVRARGVAVGDRVRAVGFGRSGDRGASGVKLVREHVKVLAVTPAEFAVGEATCSGDSGGPALDEQTGEIAGVVSRGGPTCEGPGVHNLYTRVDAFSWLVEEAFARVAGLERDGTSDAGASPPPAKGTKSKPPSDVGGPCEKGADCAAGICIFEDGGRKYCSRGCGPGDRCPTSYHCQPVSTGGSACINVR